MAVRTHARKEGRSELLLVAEADAVRHARAWLGSLASGHVLESRLPDLALAATEVVTNAVRHGAPGGNLRAWTAGVEDAVAAARAAGVP